MGVFKVLRVLPHPKWIRSCHKSLEMHFKNAQVQWKLPKSNPQRICMTMAVYSVIKLQLLLPCIKEEGETNHFCFHTII